MQKIFASLNLNSSFVKTLLNSSTPPLWNFENGNGAADD